jgi:hypothetical protein
MINYSERTCLEFLSAAFSEPDLQRFQVPNIIPFSVAHTIPKNVSQVQALCTIL